MHVRMWYECVYDMHFMLSANLLHESMSEIERQRTVTTAPAAAATTTIIMAVQKYGSNCLRTLLVIVAVGNEATASL